MRYLLILILLFILFYWGMKIFMRFFREYSRSEINEPGRKNSPLSKYANVKDAEFTEIKPDSEQKKDTKK